MNDNQPSPIGLISKNQILVKTLSFQNTGYLTIFMTPQTGQSQIQLIFYDANQSKAIKSSVKTINFNPTNLASKFVKVDTNALKGDFNYDKSIRVIFYDPTIGGALNTKFYVVDAKVSAAKASTPSALIYDIYPGDFLLDSNEKLVNCFFDMDDTNKIVWSFKMGSLQKYKFDQANKVYTASEVPYKNDFISQIVNVER